ncbi:hypothetical protein CLV51_10415 [Chitinophaga niastensis]|uniref:Lipocalin-like protein n=1 Tax=Chitinophaga niastensis TaxID=536980 RepID=A0A2P8HGJ0_CHINA|nr:hypothetical protein [Chitinophaga niastensis]PSL45313.1 hypothetical protein CLV51_10415 [Chitinophaga niastensis]
MKSCTITLLSVALATTLFSCSMEMAVAPQQPVNQGPGQPTGPTTGSVEGNWNFVGMKVYTKSIITTSGAGGPDKTITISDYETINNAGTITFNNGKAITEGLTYEVNTILKAEAFMGGISTGPMQMPFAFTLPPMGSSATYKLIGSDSLYFDQGFVGVPGSNGIPAATTASGSHISWSGDTLLLSGTESLTHTEDVSGVTMTINDTGSQTVKLLKKK